jgi:hypothetical protein
MNEFKRLTKMLAEAQEALEMLAGGEAGMLDEGTTRDDIAELIVAVQDMTSFARSRTRWTAGWTRPRRSMLAAARWLD